MTRLGLKRGRHSLVALIGVAMLCAVSVSVPAQPVFQYPETMKDVDPGIDHGNTDAALPDEYKKQRVFYRSQQPPGTIIIDTSERHLYLIENETYAIRYGIGVGRDGFAWSGSQAVTRKAEWPDWTPPQEMIARQPYLPRWVAGGEGNPLGARAMYLGSTVYRIHGTNAPETIGTKVSSGCIRLVNADVIDLYSRVTVGTQVIVLPNHSQVARTATSAPERIVAPRTADLRATTIY